MLSNERLKQKYAYNINDSTKIKKVTMGSGSDFLSLNRGFYDDIENKDISIKKNNRLLKRIKNDSLKEFVFTNVQIPDKWRNKLDYQNSVMKILARDSNFLAYVGRGGNINKNETLSTKMNTRSNLTVSGNLKKKKGYMTKSGTCYSQLFPRIDRSKISFEEKKFSGEQTQNKLRTNEEEDMSLKEMDNSNINTITRTSLPKNKNKKDVMTEKDVINLLEEFKVAYPIKLPKEEEEQIEKVNKKEKEINKTNLLFSQTFNYNQLLQKNLKYNAKDNFHKIKIKRQRAFRQNIFNNLIPHKQLIENELLTKNDDNKDNNIDLNKKIKMMSRTTSFLNSDFEFYKRIKINNPLIERNLENINFYGPFYSYCPPCLNRNLEFYNNLEHNQCLQLIHYIRKIKKKSILNIKGTNTSALTNKNKSRKTIDDKDKEDKENTINEINNERRDSVELNL